MNRLRSAAFLTGALIGLGLSITGAGIMFARVVVSLARNGFREAVFNQPMPF